MEDRDLSPHDLIARTFATAAEVVAAILLVLLIAGRIFCRGLGLPRDFGWDRIGVLAVLHEVLHNLTGKNDGQLADLLQLSASDKKLVAEGITKPITDKLVPSCAPR